MEALTVTEIASSQIMNNQIFYYCRFTKNGRSHKWDWIPSNANTNFGEQKSEFNAHLFTKTKTNATQPNLTINKSTPSISETIQLNEGEILYSLNPLISSTVPVEPRTMFKKEPIITRIIGFKKRNERLEWTVVSEDDNVPFTISHSQLRRRNLPLMLKFMKEYLMNDPKLCKE